MTKNSRSSGGGSGQVLWYGIKLLKYKHGNLSALDMASLQRAFAEGVCACVSDSEIDLLSRHLFRLAMATLPRGGGNGDDIRMGILNILRTHGIREGHRPGIDDAFLAQWHQKLHSSTTPDDIKICEAYLHFLHGGGDWGDFYWHLREFGKLTADDLKAMKVRHPHIYVETCI